MPDDYPEYEARAALFVLPALLFAALVCATRLLGDAGGPARETHSEEPHWTGVTEERSTAR